MSPWTRFKILLTSENICKEKLFHENETVQYLQSYKYLYVNKATFEWP